MLCERKIIAPCGVDCVFVISILRGAFNKFHYNQDTIRKYDI